MKRSNPKKENLEIERKKLFKKRLNVFLNSNFKWFVVLTVLLIFTFGYFFILKPKYEETLKLTQVITRYDELDINAKQRELEDIKIFLFSYSKIEKKYMDKIHEILPEKYNQEELFTEFNHIIDKNELFLKSVSINGITNLNRMKKISVTLEVGGTDYKAFKNLISHFENNLKLIDITSVRFDPNGRTTSLIINTYYLE